MSVDTRMGRGLGMQPGFMSMDAHLDTAGMQAYVCRICTKVYRDPKILNCLHSFCSQCLKDSNYVHEGDSNSPDILITCPVCQERTLLPKEGVTGLGSNHYVQRHLVEGQHTSPGMKRTVSSSGHPFMTWDSSRAKPDNYNYAQYGSTRTAAEEVFNFPSTEYARFPLEIQIPHQMEHYENQVSPTINHASTLRGGKFKFPEQPAENSTTVTSIKHIYLQKQPARKDTVTEVFETLDDLDSVLDTQQSALVTPPIDRSQTSHINVVHMQHPEEMRNDKLYDYDRHAGDSREYYTKSHSVHDRKGQNYTEAGFGQMSPGYYGSSSTRASSSTDISGLTSTTASEFMYVTPDRVAFNELESQTIETTKEIQTKQNMEHLLSALSEINSSHTQMNDVTMFDASPAIRHVAVACVAELSDTEDSDSDFEITRKRNQKFRKKTSHDNRVQTPRGQSDIFIGHSTQNTVEKKKPESVNVTYVQEIKYEPHPVTILNPGVVKNAEYASSEQSSDTATDEKKVTDTYTQNMSKVSQFTMDSTQMESTKLSKQSLQTKAEAKEEKKNKEYDDEVRTSTETTTEYTTMLVPNYADSSYLRSFKFDRDYSSEALKISLQGISDSLLCLKSEQRELLRTKLTILQAQALSIVHAIDNVNGEIVSWHRRQTDMRQKIKQRAEYLHQVIRSLERKLINEVESFEFESKFSSQVQTAKTNLHTHLRQVLDVIEFVKTLHEFGTEEEIMKMLSVVEDKMLQIQGSDVTMMQPSFLFDVPDEEINTQVESIFGMLSRDDGEQVVWTSEGVSTTEHPTPMYMATITKTSDSENSQEIGRFSTWVDRRYRLSDGGTSPGKSPDPMLSEYLHKKENLKDGRRELLERSPTASTSPQRKGGADDRVHTIAGRPQYAQKSNTFFKWTTDSSQNEDEDEVDASGGLSQRENTDGKRKEIITITVTDSDNDRTTELGKSAINVGAGQVSINADANKSSSYDQFASTSSSVSQSEQSTVKTQSSKTFSTEVSQRQSTNKSSEAASDHSRNVENKGSMETSSKSQVIDSSGGRTGGTGLLMAANMGEGGTTGGSFSSKSEETSSSMYSSSGSGVDPTSSHSQMRNRSVHTISLDPTFSQSQTKSSTDSSTNASEFDATGIHRRGWAAHGGYRGQTMADAVNLEEAKRTLLLCKRKLLEVKAATDHNPVPVATSAQRKSSHSDSGEEETAPVAGASTGSTSLNAALSKARLQQIRDNMREKANRWRTLSDS